MPEGISGDFFFLRLDTDSHELTLFLIKHELNDCILQHPDFIGIARLLYVVPMESGMNDKSEVSIAFLPFAFFLI